MGSERVGGIWLAPAKLNLMLRIVGRRHDGYHLLQTVFQFLDLADELSFSIRDDGRIKRVGSLPGVPESQDLVVRAARLLQQRTGVAQGVELHLRKYLPMGAGLGGGSSDAATTLVALNQLWGTGLSQAELAELGVSLGADVPVFVGGCAAWGEGVGERLRPLDLPEPWYLLLVPPCQVSTKQVFTDPDLTRDSPRIKIRDFLDGSEENDCLSVVCVRYPQVREAFDWLARFAQPRLTGTGGTVFAKFAHKEQARMVLRQVPDPYRAFLAKGQNRSLLYANPAASGVLPGEKRDD
ncbi:MAG: 4-(cytidine 5'-diphospho)-2-C-methyl-D-erythritol kinase [Gammaproteobacteria bacterium]|nr:4-(cytidine 5'-diphospho)-2-C-methyl-D-erythritol kinase [Gammaproteobacteria bacterium]